MPLAGFGVEPQAGPGGSPAKQIKIIKMSQSFRADACIRHGNGMFHAAQRTADYLCARPTSSRPDSIMLRPGGFFVSCSLRLCGTCRFQRSIAHSLPLWGRWPSAARSDEVVPLRPSASAGYAAAFPWSRLNLPFPSRDAGHLARKLWLLMFLFSCLLCCAWAAATSLRRGFTPAPDKGHRPLTLFRWRVPLGVVVYCSSSLAMVKASRFQLMKPPFITGLPSKGL